MKTLKKRRTQSFKEYQCEICLKTYSFEGLAISCEKAHTCKNHKPIYEFIEANSDAWWFTSKGIYSKCKICNTSLGEVDFEDIEDNQEILGQIFCLINDHINKELSHDTP